MLEILWSISHCKTTITTPKHLCVWPYNFQDSPNAFMVTTPILPLKMKYSCWLLSIKEWRMWQIKKGNRCFIYIKSTPKCLTSILKFFFFYILLRDFLHIINVVTILSLIQSKSKKFQSLAPAQTAHGLRKCWYAQIKSVSLNWFKTSFLPPWPRLGAVDFFCKRLIVNAFGFAHGVICFTTIKLCHSNDKAVINNM